MTLNNGLNIKRGSRRGDNDVEMIYYKIVDIDLIIVHLQMAKTGLQSQLYHLAMNGVADPEMESFITRMLSKARNKTDTAYRWIMDSKRGRRKKNEQPV